LTKYIGKRIVLPSIRNTQMHNRSRQEKVICPHCGAEIDRQATACPICGSDDKTGWSDQTYLDNVDLPGEDDSNYDELVEKEFGNAVKPEKLHISWKMIIGILVTAAFLFLLLRNVF
jgi:hypothetical protein